MPPPRPEITRTRDEHRRVDESRVARNDVCGDSGTAGMAHENDMLGPQGAPQGVDPGRDGVDLLRGIIVSYVSALNAARSIPTVVRVTRPEHADRHDVIAGLGQLACGRIVVSRSREVAVEDYDEIRVP
jgi:hypothetical protein